MCVAGERCEISVEREPLWRTLAITFATTAVQTSRAAAAQQHHLQTMRSGARDVTGTQLRRFNTLAGGWILACPSQRYESTRRRRFNTLAGGWHLPLPKVRRLLSSPALCTHTCAHTARESMVGRH